MNLGQYIIVRFLGFVLQFFGGMALVFVIFDIIPYDPRGVIVWFAQPATPQETEELINNLESAWGLDKPLYVQYFDFLTDLFFSGSFGNTWLNGPPGEAYLGTSVNGILGNTLVFTLTLTIISFIIILPLSLFLGSNSAKNTYSKTDLNLKLITSLLYGIPYYLFAILFLFISDIQGWTFLGIEGLVTKSAVAVGIITIVFISYQYRLVRKDFLEVLDEPYVLTAKSKGLTERVVVYKHAMRNILPELIQSYVSLFPLIISSVVIIEFLFSLPGIGFWVVFSGIFLDWGLLKGLSATFLIIIGFLNFITDVVVKMISPFDDLHPIWNE